MINSPTRSFRTAAKKADEASDKDEAGSPSLRQRERERPTMRAKTLSKGSLSRKPSGKSTKSRRSVGAHSSSSSIGGAGPAGSRGAGKDKRSGAKPGAAGAGGAGAGGGRAAKPRRDDGGEAESLPKPKRDLKFSVYNTGDDRAPLRVAPPPKRFSAGAAGADGKRRPVHAERGAKQRASGGAASTVAHSATRPKANGARAARPSPQIARRVAVETDDEDTSVDSPALRPGGEPDSEAIDAMEELLGVGSDRKVGSDASGSGSAGEGEVEAGAAGRDVDTVDGLPPIGTASGHDGPSVTATPKRGSSGLGTMLSPLDAPLTAPKAKPKRAASPQTQQASPEATAAVQQAVSVPLAEAIVRGAGHQVVDEEIAKYDASAGEEEAGGNMFAGLAAREKALVLRQARLGAGHPDLQQACQYLVLQYNSLAMQSMAMGADTCVKLLKKGEVLSGSSALFTDRAMRHRLRALTFNNFGCVHMHFGNLHTALKYLGKAQKMEAAEPGLAENPAGTHLNMCAILSQLQRFDEALKHADRALRILVRERGGLRSTGAGTGGGASGSGGGAGDGDGNGDGDSDRVDGGTSGVAASAGGGQDSSLLAVAYFNKGVQLENLFRPKDAIAAYTQARDAAASDLGAKHPMVAQMRRTIREAKVAAKKLGNSRK